MRGQRDAVAPRHALWLVGWFGGANSGNCRLVGVVACPPLMMRVSAIGVGVVLGGLLQPPRRVLEVCRGT